MELSPLHRQGLAMALFSQCFAISALIAPLVAGALLDAQGNGVALWLGMGGLCLLALPLVGQQERFQRRNLLQVLSGGGPAEAERQQIGGKRRILYRFSEGPSGKASRSGLGGKDGGRPPQA